MNQQDRLAARRPSVALLEERVHRLEARVTTLADALRLLARGLEAGPMSEPGTGRRPRRPGTLMTCSSPLRHRPGPETATGGSHQPAAVTARQADRSHVPHPTL